MMCICVPTTKISIVVLVFIHILSGDLLLIREVIWSDFFFCVCVGFLLMFACAFTGGMVGELFHVWIIQNRRMGIGLTVFQASYVSL